ncbi:leucyl/phenylalanyl-tRNA--protein transferase [Acuticoccus yangtzensis]|uniref:leucyl/phenylalanyl-tRNA--protein transferase n=1 Tax=Acuticoccus yangtzensis TaxID=1443441 RepID=UPI0009498306|nr:leucyl/phenylalanyl-tRNA--protein transferase [Acuticoccus yangtzensis]ORE92141.1 leucyl/phenylalanyl-tRNA/protein transferase [Stappia sp. 22II-S9-Z10]
MTAPDNIVLEITPEVLLKAYACGIFPMAESADDPGLYWIEPERRGILPLDSFHVPRRLARLVRQEKFEVRVDHDFTGVIEGCAAPGPGRQRTWINGRIQQLYVALHQMGQAHSVETYLNGQLVGGLYGVRLGGAFFGESMFSVVREASKVALVHLAGRLVKGGFTLLDAQFITDHLSQFGATEVSRRRYQALLDEATRYPGDFQPGVALSGEEVLAALKSAHP